MSEEPGDTPLASPSQSDQPTQSEAATLSIEDASALIERIPAHLIIQTLAQRDFASARGRIFSGFRIKPESLKTATPRGRLITEITHSTQLAEKLSEIEISSDHSKPKNHPSAASSQNPKPEKPQPDSRHKISDLQHQLRSVQAELKAKLAVIDSLEQKLAASSEQAHAFEEKLAQIADQLNWGERLRDRLTHEIAQQRQEIRVSKHGHTEHGKASSKSITSGSGSDISPYEAALDRLITRGKLDTVDLIVDETLRVDPASLSALRTRAMLKVVRADKSGALDDLAIVFKHHRNAGQIRDAALTLIKSVQIAPDRSKKMAEQLFAVASASNQAMYALAGAFDTIDGSRTYEILRSWCRPPLVDQLFRQHRDTSTTQTSALLQIRVPGTNQLEDIGVDSILRAIDTSDTKRVGAIRDSFHKLDKPTQQAIEAAVSEAAGPSYVRILTIRTLQGAAILDASNIAYYELEYLSNGKPAFRNILAVKRELFAKGYFPVVIIADANLPFVVDLPKQLRAMESRGEIELVDSGIDADEIILREAMRRDAIIVTNDYMAEWDKDEAVHKVQFSISLTDGSATLYF